LDFETPGEVKVAMIDYLKWVIRDFWVVITGSAATPAGDRRNSGTDEYDWGKLKRLLKYVSGTIDMPLIL
jgi:hypothetical protein